MFFSVNTQTCENHFTICGEKLKENEPLFELPYKKLKINHLHENKDSMPAWKIGAKMCHRYDVTSMELCHDGENVWFQCLKQIYLQSTLDISKSKFITDISK